MDGRELDKFVFPPSTFDEQLTLTQNTQGRLRRQALIMGHPHCLQHRLSGIIDPRCGRGAEAEQPLL